ncbi:Alpha/Beta hydrolase protein [Ephemerocybe angulata]|uniref:Alpha/Beta hydrolase protein n=1 Tax=Ephemerocybe angulata TaxID=980116 RepID=A0A8H6HBP6_9AGAR|nr:Alpha/Beta hydrolase protein [Tulosesus angulatus]
MSKLLQSESLCVGGLDILLYRPSDPSPLPVSLVYLLHGRLSSRGAVNAFARKLVSRMIEEGEGNTRQLWVVSLDHRNHGTRVVNDTANHGWHEGDRHNPRHAVDMYAIQLGTTRDITFLTDFLPSYLFPNGENMIADWGVVGISLGGHSAWLSLCHDARIRVGVPIIGCPNYLELMAHRAGQHGLSLEPPLLPGSLRQLIQQEDPVYKDYKSLDPEKNPFIGKKVLVLSGKEDVLVPWLASQEFVDKLEVGEDGEKRVHVVNGVGHQCTEEMQDETYTFLREMML